MLENKITSSTDREFKVNGKPVYLDHNDKWIARNLSESELKTAFNHIRTLQNTAS